MVVSDELVFVELNKTGSTHITQILRDLIGGERRGVHNPPSTTLVQSDRCFLGSIRNPWEWYVSLWAYGCQGDGALHGQLTTARLLGHGWRDNVVEAVQKLWDDLTKDQKGWKKLYADVTDADLFQRWLIRIHDESVGPYADAQGKSPLGLLSRFYANLFWHPDHKERVVRNIGSADEARHLDVEQCYIDHFIRTEHLEDDLAKVLTVILKIVPRNKVDIIYKKSKTNSSRRKRNIRYYYNQKTKNLVNEKDSLIINKFDYKMPLI